MAFMDLIQTADYERGSRQQPSIVFCCLLFQRRPVSLLLRVFAKEWNFGFDFLHSELVVRTISSQDHG